MSRETVWTPHPPHVPPDCIIKYISLKHDKFNLLTDIVMCGSGTSTGTRPPRHQPKYPFRNISVPSHNSMPSGVTRDGSKGWREPATHSCIELAMTPMPIRRPGTRDRKVLLWEPVSEVLNLFNRHRSMLRRNIALALKVGLLSSATPSSLSSIILSYSQEALESLIIPLLWGLIRSGWQMRLKAVSGVCFKVGPLLHYGQWRANHRDGWVEAGQESLSRKSITVRLLI